MICSTYRIYGCSITSQCYVSLLWSTVYFGFARPNDRGKDCGKISQSTARLYKGVRLRAMWLGRV